MVPGAAASGDAPDSAVSLVPHLVVAGKYELLHTLGRGGMGVVWAARHTQTGEALALKFLRAEPASPAEDPDSVKRFLREARAAASVQHPHVVAIREILELENGRPVLVMELLAGESLRERLARDKQMSLQAMARLLLPVASAVGTAHEQGIIHRDLKPDNIFLSRDAEDGQVVKVLDFGIAKVTRVDEQTTQSIGLTGSGEVLGTPNYMSPEQVFGERDIDQRTDIWALGVIMYECLSGVVPTKGANIGQVFKVIVAGGIRPLDAVVPDVPADVADLVRRMLARHREQRPSDLNEIVAVLARYAKVTVPAFGAPRVQAMTGGSELVPNADETLKRLAANAGDGLGGTSFNDTSSRPRFRRLTTIGLGTLAVTVLVGESLLLWRSRPPAPPRVVAVDASASVLPAAGSAPRSAEPSTSASAEPAPKVVKPPL
jgi:serine/threonine-protein kinase